MKVAALFLTFASAAWAAPALVWINGPVSHTAHYSEDVPFEKVMNEAFTAADGLNVVFLLGRHANGEEALTSWSASGVLPGVASEAENAVCVHHHVSNVQNAQSVTAMANRVGNGGALKVSLEEFSNKLESLSSPHQELMEVAANGMVSKAVHGLNKRKRALKEAQTLIVDVPVKTGPSILDNAVVLAIQSKAVGSVVLSSVRSVAEVKFERDMLVHRRRVLMEKEGYRMVQGRRGRRRLEDGNDDGNNNQDIAGTYYVSMTPNIFAGLLFFLLFAVITLIGISCMNMISGQDIYVSKMPLVGREA
ncbi:hypothetical protein ACA910_013312 [Epithemia clementina (nom. ined.)]